MRASAPRSRRSPFVLGWLLSLLLAFAHAQAWAAGELEAKIKAAYVFHVLKFVDWPQAGSEPLRLCVAGTDAVGQLLAELSGKQIKDRSLRVDMDPGADLAGCNALYIGRSERRWHDILGRLRGSVLTISDVDSFASAGGIVGFFSDNGRIKLDINPDAARQANLKISAKLLELARTVQ